MKYGKDDYLVVEAENKLVFGSVVGKGTLLLENGIEKDETTEQVSFLTKNIKANLGKNPVRGKSVYGITINPFVRSTIHPKFGQINIYFDLDPEDEERFIKRLNRAWRTLAKNKSIAAFPLTSMNLYAGKKNPQKYVQKMNKAKEVTRTADFFLQDYRDPEYVDHAVYSMAAKALWMNQVPEDVQLRWQKLYHKYLTLRTIEQTQLESIRESLNEYFRSTENANVNSYKKEMCDEEDVVVLMAITRWINQIHKVNAKQLDRLLMRDPDFVAKLWPTHVDISLPKSSISLAAEKSVEDLFCECFAFYFRGAKISRTFKKYVDLTLKNLVKKFDE